MSTRLVVGVVVVVGDDACRGEDPARPRGDDPSDDELLPGRVDERSRRRTRPATQLVDDEKRRRGDDGDEAQVKESAIGEAKYGWEIVTPVVDDDLCHVTRKPQRSETNIRDDDAVV